MLFTTAVVVVPLWLLSAIASQRPLLSAAFWLVLAVALVSLIAVLEHRACRRWRDALESALDANRAVEHRVRSSELLQIAEHEDEGPTWLFPATPTELLVLSGQEFYETDRFPCEDFSLTEISGPDGSTLRMLISVRGGKLLPTASLPASALRVIAEDTHWAPIATIPGTLTELHARLNATVP